MSIRPDVGYGGAEAKLARSMTHPALVLLIDVL